MVHYNLACYTAQEGRIEESKVYLRTALTLDKSYGAMAAEDPDLEPLWNTL